MSTKHNEKPTPLHTHIREFIEKYKDEKDKSDKLSGLARAVFLFYHEDRSDEEPKEMYNIFAKYAVDTIYEYWDSDNFYKGDVKYWEIYYFLSVCFLHGHGTKVDKKKALLHLKIAIYMIFEPPYKLLRFKKGKATKAKLDDYRYVKDSIMDNMLASIFSDTNVSYTLNDADVSEAMSNLKTSVQQLETVMTRKEHSTDSEILHDEENEN